MTLQPIATTIIPNGIYLNQAASHYVMNISPTILGSAYTPDPNDPYNEAGTWSIPNIFAGKAPPLPAVIPTSTFSLSQQLITFYIQNIGPIPINVNFVGNDTPTNYTYFSFGVPPNQTPSSYTLDPLSILIIQTVFTSNNIIRFYNSFVDTLNYDQLYRTFDQAFQVGYYDTSVPPPPSGTQVAPISENVTLTSDYTLVVKDSPYAQINISASNTGPATLTIDGTDIPGDSTYLLFVSVGSSQVNISLVDLVGTLNYKSQPFPSTLEPNTTWFIVLDNTRAVGYDGTGSNGIPPFTVRSYEPLT